MATSRTLDMFRAWLAAPTIDGIPALLAAVVTPDRSTTALAPLAISAVTAQSAQMSVGLYEMSADVDCYYRQGATGGSAVVTDGRLFGGECKLIYCPNATTKGYVQAICDTGVSGKLYLKQVI
jgi:hypothetical protein